MPVKQNYAAGDAFGPDEANALAAGVNNVGRPTDGHRLWKRKHAARGQRPVRIVSIPGDSWVAPVGASEHDRGWVSLVADAIGGGSSARSISPRAPQSVNLAGAAAFSDDQNPHMVTLTGDGIASFFALGGYTTVDVLYLRVGDAASPTVGRPQFSVDGGPWSDAYAADIDLFSPGTSYRFGRITFAGTSLRLKPHAASGSSVIFPIVARRGPLNRGVEWINWAREGWTAAKWMSVATGYTVAEPLKALPADLLHIGIGGNDANQGMTTAFMLNEIRNFITLYRQQVAPACGLFATLMPYPDASISPAAWDERMNGITDLVTEFGGFVSDWRVHMGRQSEIGDLVLGPTDFHLNDTGHRDAADIVVHALGRA